MNWTVPIIVFLTTNLWGLFGGIPYTTVQPSRSLLDRTIGSFQVASTVFTLGQTKEHLMNQTAGDRIQNEHNVRLTIPTSKLHPDPMFINALKTISSVQTSIPEKAPNDTVPPHSSTNETDLIAFALIFFGIVVLQTIAITEITRPQQDLQLEISQNIFEVRQDFHNFLTSTFPNIFQAVLGVPLEVQQGAREELQYIHRSIQNLEALPQDCVQLSIDIREAMQAQFTEMYGTLEKGLQRGFDDLKKLQAVSRDTCAQERAPPLSRANTPEAGDQDVFWRETWTEIKDDFKQTVEGFNRNLFMLNVVIDAFHDQFQRLPTMMADELTRAFKVEIKKYEIDIKIDNADTGAATGVDQLASLSSTRTNGTEMDLQEHPVVSGQAETRQEKQESPELSNPRSQGSPSEDPEFEHSEFATLTAVVE
ncbi:uncharacterized protein N7484_000620 [Penicillium longicatenatum]|uniref:uncharacterized protein n=1 Tax=Penicillium longicatenatum TaxID=1561947 RepID=UPI002546EB76|nr:uncharacterized protein N7484_000620 [Penicillium longicatenatum]KAJ5661248.1 hypothetical protein N7484_000620 [Penicillium longicatenatum]